MQTSLKAIIIGTPAIILGGTLLADVPNPEPATQPSTQPTSQPTTQPQSQPTTRPFPPMGGGGAGRRG